MFSDLHFHNFRGWTACSLYCYIVARSSITPNGNNRNLCKLRNWVAVNTLKGDHIRENHSVLQICQNYQYTIDTPCCHSLRHFPLHVRPEYTGKWYLRCCIWFCMNFTGSHSLQRTPRCALPRQWICFLRNNGTLAVPAMSQLMAWIMSCPANIHGDRVTKGTHRPSSSSFGMVIQQNLLYIKLRCIMWLGGFFLEK